MARATRRVAQAAFACAAVIGLVVGCGADGSGGPIDEATDPQPTDPGATLPPPSDPGTPPAATDAGAAKKDASPPPVDAGPPPPDPGTACPTIDEVKTRSCGACGTQSTLCEADGDSGAGKWSAYGPCTGELAGGCIPGTVTTEACGNCGTLTKTCTKYCAYTSTTCSGEPAGSCAPGNVDLSSASCTTPNTYRQRTCGSTCTYGSFGASCAPPPTTVEVPVTAGQVTGTLVTFSSDQTAALLAGTCPSATTSTTTTTAYTYVTVHNPNALSATVAIYNSQATGGTVFTTELAAYDGTTVPANRATCLKGVATYGTSALTGSSSFASLDNTRAVTIPAGGSVIVYDAARSATTTAGTAQFNVKLVSLQ
jgi:hypothetical protein